MKILRRLLLLLLVVAIILSAVTLIDGHNRYKSALEAKPLEVAVSEIESAEHYTKYEDIPEFYFKALVAVEDRRFYKHNGFDLRGTIRAVYTDLKAGKWMEGGSTISQQLAKNMYFPLDYTLNRKIAEIYMALDIEKKYDKKKVLELYVNGIYYGSGYYNIYDAAMGYFGKIPDEMNEYECSLLVGIPNAPSVYSLDVDPKLAHQRQNKVLSTMVECKYITEEEAEKIKEMRPEKYK